jgi:hypothetical protein
VGSLSSFHRAYAVGAVVAVFAGVCGFFMRDTPRPGKQARVLEGSADDT